MTMSIELTRIELAGPAETGGPSGRSENSPLRYSGSALVWVPVALIAGAGAWALLSGDAGKPAGSEPVRLAAAVASAPAARPIAFRVRLQSPDR